MQNTLTTGDMLTGLTFEVSKAINVDPILQMANRQMAKNR